MANKRSNPEISLREVKWAENKASRGHLKIYLGAAPGVGKTYEMLHDAFEKKSKKLDVVVGVVESHGREMIESMLVQFEQIPRQTVEYREHSYHEFDLDAALKRNPGLILVDEMAHTNAPGLRHEKRWQDIQELLDNGIDVCTTLNVQHIESLKDDVAQIIQAPIKETVPDLMIERADTIELIDLPVDELLKRLREGKIYIPKQAEFAMERYFRRGHLIALRELALRTTAAAVETEVLLYRQSEGIKKIWPVKDKILVAVGDNPESLKLIRVARQMAHSLQAEWLAVYVDTPQIYHMTNRRNRAIEHLRLAQQLGAETHVLIGSSIVKTIVQFAQEKNVTQIMVWKFAQQPWWRSLKKTVADDVLMHCGEINVYIVTGERDESLRDADKKKPIAKDDYRFKWRHYVVAGGTVVFVTALNVFLAPYVASSDLLMMYLLGVAFVALLGHFGSSMFASIVSVMAYGFFQDHDILTLLVMFFVTQALSYLTLWKHRKAEMANQVQQQTGALYALSRQLLVTRGLDDLLRLGETYIGDIFNAQVSVFLPNKQSLQHRKNNQFQHIVDEKEQSVAEWVYKMKQAAGLGTDTLSLSNALYLPLASSVDVLGVIKIQPQKDALYTPEQRRLLDACVTQLTLAIEVDRLQEKSHQKEMKTEIESARDRLLKRIGDQLNTPLQVISKAIRSHHEQETSLDPIQVHRELSRVRLMNRNILQLIDFESQSIVMHKVELSLHQMLADVIESFKKITNQSSIRLHWPLDGPKTIVADGDLLQAVMLNLLDNAEKFSPTHAEIDVEIAVRAHEVIVSVVNPSDEMSQDELHHLFKKFYRGRAFSKQYGLGLGLTLCQKIIEAHSGRIWAEHLSEKRAIALRFTLPISFD